MRIFIIILITILTFNHQLQAQENYEIQVYGSETVEKHYTMLELHSNFTFDGQKTTVNDVLPTHHVFHETIEVTHGFTDWFETGFYIFTTIGSNNRTNYVGSHIRPRVRIPTAWKWPVGVSLSGEVGYQKKEYSEDDWTLEIRPIIDKQFKKLYLSFNPTLDKSLHGLNQHEGFVFSPNFKASYAVTKKLSPGIEYYGAAGSMPFNPWKYDQNQIFICLDADISPDWEFNCGFGWGLTSTTDNAIIKVILGRRIH